MKIDRLLGIVTILLQKKIITAPELSKRFEVSRRTIQRDIEDLCKAGIPIITQQGGNGGIYIAEGFTLDKSLLTKEDLQSIIAGLKSLESVEAIPKYQGLVEKLSIKNSNAVSSDQVIQIDLSSHYKSSLSEKINLFSEAITHRKLVCFDYYSNKGMQKRRVEPYFITFKWTTWYLFGFCLEREEFRLFKLNRLWQPIVLEEVFSKREIPSHSADFDAYFHDNNMVKIIFDSSLEYLLVEEYGPTSYTRMENGSLLFSVGYTNKDHIIRWILGFGHLAMVLEPLELATEIKNIWKKAYHLYEHDI